MSFQRGKLVRVARGVSKNMVGFLTEERTIDGVAFYCVWNATNQAWILPQNIVEVPADDDEETNQTLLVWEEIPEKTRLYVLPKNVYEEFAPHFREAHGKFINSDEMNDGLEFLNSALSTKEEYVNPQSPMKKHACILKDYEVDWAEAPIAGSFSRIIISGYVM